jgi:hypothetical protein
VSYQPEERYWTDYVRVAIPIVGLLVLLGVFWYWAHSLIGETSGSPPPTEVAQVTVVTAPTFTPSPTEEITVVPKTVVPTATEGGEPPTATEQGGGGVAASEIPTETASETPAEPQFGFCTGCTVIVRVDDSVRMRSEPSLNGEVLGQYVDGDQLVILEDQPQEADGFTWWHVRDDANNLEGWVVDDFLKTS